MTNQDIKPDPELDTEQAEAVANLAPEDIKKIEQLLFDQTGDNWKKVAMIVASAMIESEKKYQGIPDIYFAQRVRKLVLGGTLEAQGFIGNMRYSEVRRAS